MVPEIGVLRRATVGEKFGLSLGTVARLVFHVEKYVPRPVRGCLAAEAEEANDQREDAEDN